MTPWSFHSPTINRWEEFPTVEGLLRSGQLLAIENYETSRFKGENELCLFHTRNSVSLKLQKEADIRVTQD